MKKDILFVVDELKYGGVSKVLCDILKVFDYTLYDVSVLCLHKHGEFISRLPKNVEILSGSPIFSIIDQKISQLVKDKDLVGIARKIHMAFLIKTGLIEARIRLERKLFLSKRYDVEIAYKDGFCTLFVAAGNARKKLSWIHSDYGAYNYSHKYIGTMKRALAKMNENIAVAQTAANSFQKVFSLEVSPTVIHNVMDIDDILNSAKENVSIFDPKCFNIISVGRLCDPKGYDRLANVHTRLIARGLWHRVYIIGAGEDLDKIQAQLKALKIEKTFTLLGYQSNPYPYMKNADLYVSSSRFEGYSVSILESLILKVPVLSTDVSGIQEQLKQGQYGKIVDNTEEALFDGLSMILSDPNECAVYRKNLESYTYDNQAIMNQIYERL